MSTLTFREQAAIALYVSDTRRTVEMAQKLAEACCEAWGHDGLMSCKCDRCGAYVNKIESEDGR